VHKYDGQKNICHSIYDTALCIATHDQKKREKRFCSDSKPSSPSSLPAFPPYLCSILPAASEYLYILWRYVWLFWVSTLTRYIRLFLCQNCNWSPCSLAQFLRRVSFNAWRHVNYFGFSRYSESTASCDRTLLYKLHPAGANPAMHDKDVIEDLSDLIRSRKARPASDNTQNDMPTTDLPRWIDNRE